MKKLFFRIRALIPAYARPLLIGCLLSDLIAYYLPRLIDFGIDYYDFTTPLDRAMPILPVFAYVYILAFPFWAVSYVMICRHSEILGRRLFYADTFAKLVCLVCYFVIPSTLTLPAADELHGVGAWLTKLIYSMDQPNNLLPSIHCFVSYLSFRPMLTRQGRTLPCAYIAFTIVFAVLIFLSTLFIRQHVIWDFVAGVAVAEAGWLLSRLFVSERQK